MGITTAYTTAGTVTLDNDPTPPGGSNDLETAAIALPAGSTSASYVAFTPATLSVLMDGVDITDWCVRWHWDPVGNIGWLMCKAAESNGSPPYKLFKYDAATSVFTKVYDLRAGLGGTNLTGHGYDGGAVGPAGDFYFLQYRNEQVVRWTGSAWVNASSAYISDDSSGPRSLAVLPNCYGTGVPGFVGLLNNGRIRTARVSDGTSGTWTTFQTAYTAVTYSQSAYCAELDAQIITCGITGLEAYMVTGGATPTVARLPNAPGSNLPIRCSSSQSSGDANMSRLVPTPSGSVAILESATPGRVWRLNTTSFSWDLQSYTHTLRTDSASWPVMYASTYGVYWALREVDDGRSPPNSILWRPPSGL